MKKKHAPWTVLVMALVAASTLTSCGPTPLPAVDPAPMSDPGTFRFVDEDSKGVSTTFITRKVDGNRIAYVLDYSGSMAGEGKTALLQELANSVTNIPNEAERMVSVITFDNTATVLVVPGAEPAPGTALGWYATSNSSNQALLQSARDKDTGGGTEWGPALKLALHLSPKPDVMYFVTDGAPGDRQLSAVIDEVLALNQADGSPAIIVPFCTDDTISAEAMAQLKRLDTAVAQPGTGVPAGSAKMPSPSQPTATTPSPRRR